MTEKGRAMQAHIVLKLAQANFHRWRKDPKETRKCGAGRAAPIWGSGTLASMLVILIRLSTPPNLQGSRSPCGNAISGLRK
jgi:hypothetical protein